MKRRTLNIIVTLLCLLAVAAAVVCAPWSGNRAAAYIIMAAALAFGYIVAAPFIGK